MQAQMNLFDEAAPQEKRDRMADYFFLISPDQATSKGVRALKEKMYSRIQVSQASLRSLSHISVFKCRYPDNCEALLIGMAEGALKEINGFKVRLDGWDIYKHGQASRSLVLRIGDPGPIETLRRSLLKKFRFHDRRTVPHLTIARAVPTRNFNKVFSFLPEFDYRSEFFCDKVTILKKMVDGDKDQPYRVVHQALLS
jgi:2'-5' RNA ligase